MKISKNIKRKKPSAFLTGLMMFTITTSCLSMSNSSWKQVEAATSGESRIFNNTSTGRVGADTNNSSGTLGGGITISGGIYNWTVPESGTYSIEVWGAQGGASLNGSYAGGKGARMKGDFSLTKGTILKILVGQQGVAGQGGSGGGGTFITKSDNTALIVAGGGGGAHNNAGGNGITTNSGTSGGIGTSYGGGGGGFSGSGTYATSDSNIKGGAAGCRLHQARLPVHTFP